MPNKIDQIAFYADSEWAEDLVKKHFGLQHATWIVDHVVGRSIVYGVEGINEAKLQFNYDLGIEVEILRYTKGGSWHHNFIRSGRAISHIGLAFISHIGLHVEEFPEIYEAGTLVQETWTQSHTSDYLTKPDSPGFGRKYHYRIYEIGARCYIKYIKRILPTKGE